MLRGFPFYKKSPESEDSGLWQRVKDSNPHIQSQSLLCYHYTNPLYLSAVANRYYYTKIFDFVNRFSKLFLLFIFSVFKKGEAWKGLSVPLYQLVPHGGRPHPYTTLTI